MISILLGSISSHSQDLYMVNFGILCVYFVHLKAKLGQHFPELCVFCRPQIRQIFSCYVLQVAFGIVISSGDKKKNVPDEVPH